MKALIVAAGIGSRMGGDIPKPLCKVAGKPMLEIIILNLKEFAKINEFYIVVGYKAEQIKQEIGDGSAFGVKINYLFNSEYEKPAGISVRKGQGVINEDFILCMCDYIYQPEILKEFSKFKKEKDECVIIVSKDLSDAETATKAKVVGDKVISIGKKIIDFNRIECGLHYCSPNFFDVLKQLQNKGIFSLNAAREQYAEKEKLRAYDIKDYKMIDIDTPEDLQKAKNFVKTNFKSSSIEKK